MFIDDGLFGIDGDGVASHLKFDFLVLLRVLALPNEIIDEGRALNNKIEYETELNEQKAQREEYDRAQMAVAWHE